MFFAPLRLCVEKSAGLRDGTAFIGLIPAVKKGCRAMGGLAFEG